MIDSTAFAALPSIQQTEKMLEITEKRESRSLAFVPNFDSFSDGPAILSRLMAGEDVAVELEFNGIEVSDEIREALRVVRPLLTALDAMKPTYSWLPEIPLPPNVSTTSTRVNRGGYAIGRFTAKWIWDSALHHWAGGGPARQFSVTADGFNRKVRIGPGGIFIGCQEIPRAEVEAIARALGFEPNIKGKETK